MVGNIWTKKDDLALGLIDGRIKKNELLVQVHCLFIGRYNLYVLLSHALTFFVSLAAPLSYPFFITLFDLTLYVSRSSSRNFPEERLRRI